MPNTEDIPIVCKSAVDVGTDAHKWPDAMQKYFNTEEMKLTAQRGRHAVRVIDQCVGSHDKWQVRRILTFTLPSGRDLPRESSVDGPLERSAPHRDSSDSSDSSGSAGPGEGRAGR